MTIQYIMLVSLGFLIASLITLLLAPIFWHRAVRLTSTKLRQSLPLTEQEILADKDQLRAKYAIRVHQLEKQVEQSTLGTARQKIDINRRDASITTLETEINKLKAENEESLNARSVLEQTVSDRIPKIEAKLEEARKLLTVRDHELSELSQSSRRQQEAYTEARVITQKQASDIERLRSQVLAYEAQTRNGGADGDMEGQLAIRTELEMLRARTRDQASLIDRLNAEISVSRTNFPGATSNTGLGADNGSATNGQVIALSGGGENGRFGDLAGGGVGADSERLIMDLRREVAVLQTQLEQAKSASEATAAANRQNAGVETAVERELRTTKAMAEDQSAEITRLRAELAATTADASSGEGAMPSLRDNKIALKARLSGLEAKSNQQGETIQRLRAELAQINERSARQAANFVEEMRRLGLAAHITQPRTGRPQEQPQSRARNVTRRTQAVFEASRALGQSPPALASTPDPAASGAPPSAPSSLGRRLVASSRMGGAGPSSSPGSPVPVAETITAPIGDNTEKPAAGPVRGDALIAALRGSNGASKHASQPSVASPSVASTLSAPASVTAALGAPAPDPASSANDGAGGSEPRRPRLLDRITTAADGQS